MSESGRILVVDGEPQIRRMLRTTLVAQGYKVWGARRGDEALELVRTERFGLILLDINLPDVTGIEVCRAIRSRFSAPIIVLTARDSEEDKIAVLDAGANDYVTKPFEVSELLARVRAHVRRYKVVTEDIFVCDEFVIDFSARAVTRQSRKIRLSPKEYQLLRYFLEHRGALLSHRKLLQAIWGPDHGEERILVQAVVMQLRKKIEPDPKHPRYITTVPWMGYRFEG